MMRNRRQQIQYVVEQNLSLNEGLGSFLMGLGGLYDFIPKAERKAGKGAIGLGVRKFLSSPLSPVSGSLTRAADLAYGKDVKPYGLKGEDPALGEYSGPVSKLV